MKNVYCIPGLWADEGIFQNLDLPGMQLKFVKWIPPMENESLPHYAERLSAQIEESNPILMGVSFGGMLAIEISHILSVKKLVLISSIRSQAELPIWMKFSGKLHLNRAMLPAKPPAILEPLENWFLGVSTMEERSLVHHYRVNVDRFHLQWSIDQILHWKNSVWPESLYQIHGDRDRIFPIGKLNPTHTIKGGGHLMVMTKAPELSSILISIFSAES